MYLKFSGIQSLEFSKGATFQSEICTTSKPCKYIIFLKKWVWIPIFSLAGEAYIDFFSLISWGKIKLQHSIVLFKIIILGQIWHFFSSKMCSLIYFILITFLADKNNGWDKTWNVNGWDKTWNVSWQQAKLYFNTKISHNLSQQYMLKIRAMCI